LGEPDYFFGERWAKSMKKLLGITLAIASLGIGVSAEAKTTDVSQQNSTVAASSAPQWQRDRYGRRYEGRRYDRRYNRQRSVTQSRLVRYGRRVYRETYVVTYWPNGRTNTRLISRTRVG
jgi:hypothetical protein